MECIEAQPFVSELHDGETIPQPAAYHIAACPACRLHMRAYAEIGVGLRLLASLMHDDFMAPLPKLALRRSSWFSTYSLTSRVSFPRFAVALSIVAFLGLFVGLGLMWAQTSGAWFQFQVTAPENHASWGAQTQVRTALGPVATRVGSVARIVTQVRVLKIRKDRVRVSVKAQRAEDQSFESAKSSREDYLQTLNQILSSTPASEFSYVPGQVLQIPVTGGGTITLTGRVLEHPAGFFPSDITLTPGPDQMAVTDFAITRDKELLGSKLGSGSVQEEDPGIEVYVPHAGRLIFMIHPVAGATKAEAEFGQIHFTLDGHDYFLFSETPITGGDQPKNIWVYRDSNYHPSGKLPESAVFLGVGSVSSMLRPN